MTDSAPPRVLLVDDERDLVDAYVRLLNRSGFNCDGAFNLEQASGLLDNHKFDLIITDLSLPHSSGLEIIKHARRGSPPIPVIVMTGYNSPEIVRAAAAAGADLCLLKPVSIVELVRTIRDTLARHRIERIC